MMVMTSATLRRLRQFLVIFISIAFIHQLINLSYFASHHNKRRFRALTNRGRPQQHDSLMNPTLGPIHVSADVLGKRLIEGKRHVIFNALPKTGSRTLHTVARNIAINRGMRVENTMALENETIRHKIDRVLNDTTPTFIYSHLPFYHIPKENPVFVSIVRDPVERLVSLYYFKVYGDSTDPSTFREEMDKMNYTKESFDDCYSKRGICVSKGLLTKNIQQFCGVPPRHPYPSAATCLRRSKRNIKNKYLLVGVMEDYDGFLQVLEKLLPHMFEGATTFYRNFKRKSYLNATATLHKRNPSKTVQKALRSELRMEYEIYDFIKKEFEELKAQLKLSVYSLHIAEWLKAAQS